jgi:hypothetical protein
MNMEQFSWQPNQIRCIILHIYDEDLLMKAYNFHSPTIPLIKRKAFFYQLDCPIKTFHLLFWEVPTQRKMFCAALLQGIHSLFISFNYIINILISVIFYHYHHSHLMRVRFTNIRNIVRWNDSIMMRCQSGWSIRNFFEIFAFNYWYHVSNQDKYHLYISLFTATAFSELNFLYF